MHGVDWVKKGLLGINDKGAVTRKENEIDSNFWNEINKDNNGVKPYKNQKAFFKEEKSIGEFHKKEENKELKNLFKTLVYNKDNIKYIKGNEVFYDAKDLDKNLNKALIKKDNENYAKTFLDNSDTISYVSENLEFINSLAGSPVEEKNVKNIAQASHIATNIVSSIIKKTPAAFANSFIYLGKNCNSQFFGEQICLNLKNVNEEYLYGGAPYIASIVVNYNFHNISMLDNAILNGSQYLMTQNKTLEKNVVPIMAFGSSLNGAVSHNNKIIKIIDALKSVALAPTAFNIFRKVLNEATEGTSTAYNQAIEGMNTVYNKVANFPKTLDIVYTDDWYNIKSILQKLNLHLNEYDDIENSDEEEIINITKVSGFENLSKEQKYILLKFQQQNGMTFLHKAIDQGKLEDIQSIMNAFEVDVLQDALTIETDTGYTVCDLAENLDSLSDACSKTIDTF